MLEERDVFNNWKLSIPVAMTIFLVPLIVRLSVVPLTENEIALWGGMKNDADLLSYSRMKVLVMLSVVALCYMILKIVIGELDIKKSKVYIPLAIYVLAILASTLFSDNFTTASRGVVQRYEGMWALLSYILLMFITMNVVESKKSIKVITWALMISATLMGIVGVCQYIGHDPLMSEIGKKIIVPSRFASVRETLKMNMEKGRIYVTLNNPNYVGSYAAMVIPFAFVLLAFIKDKKYKFMLLIVNIIVLINLIGSLSRGGIVGLAFAFIVLAIMCSKRLLKHKKAMIITLIALVIGLVGVNFATHNALGKRVSSLSTDAKAMLTSSQKEEKTLVQSITSDEGNVIVKEKYKELIITSEDNGVFFKNENNEVLPTEVDNETGAVKIKDENYSNYDLKVMNYNGYNVVHLQEKALDVGFIKQLTRFKYFNLETQKISDIEDVKHFGFEGKEALGSGRGYIWSRTIPMLKNDILIGSGADTFALNFPQYDYIGRLNFPDGKDILIDKPHNLYLNIGVTTGVVSLIAFLAIVIMYIVSSVKLYFKCELDDFYTISGLSVFVGICGYLAAGMFNDSIVAVAPVFWVLLGMGFAINMRIKSLTEIMARLER